MKISYYVVVILVFFIFVTTALIFWPYMWKDNFLSKWSSIVTIFSVIIAPIFYFIRISKKESYIRNKECKERKHISRILYNEIRDVLNFFDVDRNPHIRKIEMKGLIIYGKKIPDELIIYVNHHINRDMYDSIKFSGNLGLLNYTLHYDLQNIFSILKLYDEYLDKIYLVEDNMWLYSKKDIIQDNAYKVKTYRYYKQLKYYEQKLLKDIPIMMVHLKQEFNVKC